MVISALDLFGNMTAGINGKSWRIVSPDGMTQTVVDNETDLNKFIAAGYKIIKEFNK